MDPLLMAPAELKTESVFILCPLQVLKRDVKNPVSTCYVEQSLQSRGALPVHGVDRNGLWKPTETQTRAVRQAVAERWRMSQ